jgi:CDP-diacylglycerol--glycerol-3-phosphate 3-phosphatidyltransferase
LTTELELLLFVLGLGLVSMLAFALTGGRQDADALRKGTRFAGTAGVFLVHWFLWVLGPPERLFLRWRVRPDVFNFVGLGFGALSGVLIGLGHLKAGGWAIALGGACDIFDGRMARGLGVDSSYGKFIDSTLDRFVEVFVFLGFVVALRGFTWGPLVVTAAICGSLLVSYARARGESLGVLCKEGLMQRAERLALTCLACLSDPALTSHLGLRPGSVLLGTLLLIAVGTFGTAAHRTLWISRRLLERG